MKEHGWASRSMNAHVPANAAHFWSCDAQTNVFVLEYFGCRVFLRAVCLQFLDKSRQKAHEKRLEEKARTVEVDIQQKKLSHQSKTSTAALKEKRVNAAKRRQNESKQDVSDFASEYTLLKRLKKGKLSEVSSSGSPKPASVSLLHLSRDQVFQSAQLQSCKSKKHFLKRARQFSHECLFSKGP